MYRQFRFGHERRHESSTAFEVATGRIKYHKEDSHYLHIIVSHLRQKLGDYPAEPSYIRTEAGVGYRLSLQDIDG